MNDKSTGLGDGSLYIYVDLANNTPDLYSTVWLDLTCRNDAGDVVATGTGSVDNLASGEIDTATIVVLDAANCTRYQVEISDAYR